MGSILSEIRGTPYRVLVDEMGEDAGADPS
jgi:hypothetical protein